MITEDEMQLYSIKILTTLSGILLCATIAASIILYSFNLSTTPTRFTFICIVLSTLPLVLIGINRHTHAKRLFCIIPLLQILIADIYSSTDPIGFHYLYLGLPIFTPLVFTADEKKSRIFFTCLPILFFLGKEAAGFYGFPYSNFEHHRNFDSTLFSLFFMFGSLMLSVHISSYYQSQNDQKQKQLIRELRQKNAEIKILKGLLPICSSCKKIRDDQGYWKRMESYIQENSEAEFSHSLCPDCMEKLYGGEDWFEKIRKKLKE